MSLSSAHRRLDTISRYAARAGGAGILIIALITTVSVLARKLFPTALPDVTELSGYIFAIGVAFSLPFVFLQRANIRIDTLYTLLPRKAGAALDVLSAVAFTVVTALLANSAVKLFLSSWSANSISVGALSVPLWIPQFFWILGMVLFLAVTIFVSFYAAILLLRGKLDMVGKLAGLPSLAEEIREIESIGDPITDQLAGRAGT